MMPQTARLVIAPATDHLPSIFLDAVSDPEVAPQFAIPWIEDQHVFATDGALIVCYPLSQLSDSTVRTLPPWTAAHPIGMLDFMRQCGPFSRDPTGLPPRDIEPDAERPACTECDRGRHRRSRILSFSDASSFCPGCGGSGVMPMTGRGIWFLDATDYHPRIGLDAWYVTLLRRYGASVFAPLDVSFSRITPFKFTIGQHCWGLVQPKAEPRIA